jgi:hypothetical protein
MAVLVISYSRVDQPQVRAVVSLLQTALRGFERAVFWDGDLEPGDLWFEELKSHIDEAPQLFVFWCDHSSRSDQVRREFLYAFERKKQVIPVLLDDTPLSTELAAIHGIDLRRAIRHDQASRATKAWWLGIAAVALIAALATPFMLLRAPSSPESIPGSPQPVPSVAAPRPTEGPAPQPRPPDPTPTTSVPNVNDLRSNMDPILIGGVILVALAGTVVVIRRRKTRHRIVREFANFLE